MVLGWIRPGRVGRRRISHRRPVASAAGLRTFSGLPVGVGRLARCPRTTDPLAPDAGQAVKAGADPLVGRGGAVTALAVAAAVPARAPAVREVPMAAARARSVVVPVVRLDEMAAQGRGVAARAAARAGRVAVNGPRVVPAVAAAGRADVPPARGVAKATGPMATVVRPKVRHGGGAWAGEGRLGSARPVPTLVARRGLRAETSALTPVTNRSGGNGSTRFGPRPPVRYAGAEPSPPRRAGGDPSRPDGSDRRPRPHGVQTTRPTSHPKNGGAAPLGRPGPAPGGPRPARSWYRPWGRPVGPGPTSAYEMPPTPTSGNAMARPVSC